MWAHLDVDLRDNPDLRATRLITTATGVWAVVRESNDQETGWAAYAPDDYVNATGMIGVYGMTEAEVIHAARETR